MRPWTREVLVCPGCRLPLGGGEGPDAILSCPSCALQVPVLEGFPFVTEAGLDLPPLEDLRERLLGDPAAYAAHEARKVARGTLDAYAAFHPFNESTRVIEAMAPLMQAVLRPGDLILDVWCRTGWSGEWLASRFPEQRVIALWEADAGVLGYKGFRRWLGEDRRAPNLDVVFAHPDRPLPFADHAFRIVHTADLLHRYPLVPMAAECIRVGAPDGLSIFPHVHMANSEPEPFFERGGTKRHGREYRAWLDRIEVSTGRRGWVLGEARLFEQGASFPLTDEAETHDYNGFVVVGPAIPTSSNLTSSSGLAQREPEDPTANLPRSPAPAAALTSELLGPRVSAPAGLRSEDDGVNKKGFQFLLNPLFRLSFARSTARVDPSLRDGAAGHLLFRHVVYQNRLPARPVPLSAWQMLQLALAAAGERLPLAGLELLIEAELLRPAIVPPEMVELQRFHAGQRPVQARGDLLAGLLEDLAASDAAAVRSAEGDEVSGRDLAGAVAALIPALGNGPLRLGGVEGPAGLALVLAAMAAGIELDLTGGEDPGAVLEKAQPEAAMAAVRPGGRLVLDCDGEPVPVAADLLLEAAASIRTAVSPGDTPGGDLGAATTLLAALTALMAGEVVGFTP